MKKIYLKQLKTWTLSAAMLLTTSGLMAQEPVDLTWNGSISSDASETQNWSPEGNMAGNNLIFKNTSYYTNACVITGTETIDVNIFNMDAWSETVNETYIPVGEVTINMSQGATFRVNAESVSGTGDYTGGILNITGGEGNFHYAPNRNFYIDNNETVVNIDCDTVTFRHWVGLGDRNGTKGGQLNITGHSYVTMGSLDRIPLNLGRVHLYLADEAQIYVNGDIVTWIEERIATGSIGTTEDKDVVADYDNFTNKTHIYLRDKTAFVIEPITKQLLSAGEVGDSVYVIQNDGYSNMASIEWVYGTEDGSYTMSFDPAQINNYIKPIFPNSGNYFMALKGIDGDGVIHYSNSVEFDISSNKVSVSPAVVQYLRVTQMSGMVTITETETATSREWKYSTTTGGPYVSFDTPITGTEFNYTFTEVGTYFVVCESLIGSNTERTKELQFNVSEWNASALNMTFEGTYDNTARNIFNYDYAAYIHQNGINIPTGFDVTIDGLNKDTLRNIWIAANATLTLTGTSTTDTLWYRPNNDYAGEGAYILEKGVFVLGSSTYMRFYKETSTFTVKNDAKAVMDGSFLMGPSNTPAVGSHIYIQDDAVVLFNTLPGRISANQGHSEFHLEGNAEYHFAGDVRSSIATWLTGTVVDGVITFYPKFITPEGFEPQMIYDEVQNLTIVSVRALSAFGIEQTKSQIVSKNQLTNSLSLLNATGYDSYEWMWSTGPSGPFQSFDPAITGETAQVSFSEAGTYYVVCYATTGTTTDRSNNVVPVKVYDIAVSPAATQYIDFYPNDNNGTELSYTLPDGATAVQWKYSTTSGGPYNEFFPVQETSSTFTPYDLDEGSYYVVFEAYVLDDDGASVYLTSNEVAIMVGVTAIGDNKAAKVSLYPNPSDGNFFIDVEEGEGSTIEVINAAGATVSSQVVSGAGKVPVSVSTKGLYLVKVTTGNSVTVKRVIVK
ncbi:T9SS type A sorting domain-containing protein [Carboxylicivirga caseinilyticus]|uniref:T9SS type A sorting domain-containing protein n=1 Tax=Carboxylicivirga caseinilyticus TaxID=3417572 RepID=UPI003D35228C|nr:T9SS type A sorting domain-containing protein [Marinilabiliaceae bacterium A049]